MNFLTAATHLLITLPSLIYHTTINKYAYYFGGDPIIDNENKDIREVIIFVHGRGGFRTDFHPLINNLKNIPFILKAINLGDTRDTSIDEDCLKLHEELEPYEGYNIILVGLSKGGMVVAKYPLLYKDKRIEKIITISAPLKGTHIASFAIFSPITKKELMCGSDICKEIQQNSTIPMYHVVPKYDHMIVPNNSAKLDDTPEDNIYYYDGYYAHNGILYSPDVANAIIRWVLPIQVI